MNKRANQEQMKRGKKEERAFMKNYLKEIVKNATTTTRSEKYVLYVCGF
jgi:hypothetical protein